MNVRSFATFVAGVNHFGLILQIFSKTEIKFLCPIQTRKQDTVSNWSLLTLFPSSSIAAYPAQGP